jgi:DNA-binding transcriptional MerR regulator
MTVPLHLSIGEVLSLLQAEFPDVTISKIRFLESQGLIDPERTPSGYRKFYPADIDRLRWVLRQQRDAFLPLKVIREKIQRGEHLGRFDDTDVVEHPPGAGPEPSPEDVPTGMMDVEELAAASGLEPRQIVELERYGLVQPRTVGNTTVYDHDALVVCRLAVRFAAFGVESRHLRMYRSAAEREAGVFEQVVIPLEKQRNPSARRQARENLKELASLGERLHRAMLAQVLRPHIEQ